MKIGTKSTIAMKKNFYIITAAALSLVACSRNQEVDVPDANLSIFARTESPADTKTVVESGVHVYWEPGDEIAVFTGEQSAKFTTDITAASGTATFKGTFGDATWPEDLDLWAVYPFSEDAVFDGETITTTLPSEQVAREGSFGKDMNLAIAHSNSSTLQFYNVGGGIRFSVTEEGIKKVMFEGLSGEIISGKVKIGMDENGKPVVKEVTGGSQFITLLPPTGQETFEPGAWYYIVAIPGTLEGGYKLRFYKNSDYARKVSEKAVTIKRSIFGNIEKADDGTAYKTTTMPFPETEEEWEEVKERVISATASVDSFYLEYDSVEEMSQQIDEVKRIEGVVDAYATETCFYVDIDGWGIIGYLYDDYYDAGLELNTELPNQIRSLSGTRSAGSASTRLNGEYNACIMNAQHQERMWTQEVVKATEEMFKKSGVSVSVNNSPNLDFFKTDIYDYNLVFIIAHGEYDDKKDLHWLQTAESFKKETLLYDIFGEQFDELKENWYEKIKDDQIRLFHRKETRNGIRGIVSSYSISEKYIEKSSKSFTENGKAVIFMVPCQSLKGNSKTHNGKRIDDSIAEALFSKGAGLYIGYDESSSALAQFGGMRFFASLLSGMSFEKALDFPKSDQALKEHWPEGSTYTFEHAKDYNKDGTLNREWDVNQHVLTSNGFKMESFIISPYMISEDNPYVSDNGYYFSACANYCPDVSLYLADCFHYYSGEAAPATIDFSFVNDDRPQYGFAISKGNEISYGACYPATVEWYSIFQQANLEFFLPFESLEPGSEYHVWPYIAVGNSFNYGEPIVFTTEDLPAPSIPEAKDLGLSVKWASFNLGAMKPEDYGVYFAWGETEPYYYRLVPSPVWNEGKEAGYDWPSYKWCNGSSSSITKYNSSSLTQLEPEDDAAHVNLGDKWRIPTESEWAELRNNCSFTWTTQDGVNGLLVTSLKPGYTNVSIFLPAAGAVGNTSLHYLGESGFYWTSGNNTSIKENAGYNTFETGSSGLGYGWIDRCYGLSIRPVYGDPVIPVDGDGNLDDIPGHNI